MEQSIGINRYLTILINSRFGVKDIVLRKVATFY